MVERPGSNDKTDRLSVLQTYSTPVTIPNNPGGFNEKTRIVTEIRLLFSKVTCYFSERFLLTHSRCLGKTKLCSISWIKFQAQTDTELLTFPVVLMCSNNFTLNLCSNSFVTVLKDAIEKTETT